MLYTEMLGTEMLWNEMLCTEMTTLRPIMIFGKEGGSIDVSETGRCEWHCAENGTVCRACAGLDGSAVCTLSAAAQGGALWVQREAQSVPTVCTFSVLELTPRPGLL